jgi:hypothetical protein
MVVVVTCVALSGCGAIQAVKMKEARMQLKDAEADCRAQWPTLTKETAVPRANCVSDAEEAILVPVSGNYADLIEQRIAFRRLLARKVASGEVSPEDAQFRFAQFNSELAGQANARRAQTMEANAEAQSAFANSMAASAAMIQAAKPVYTPPPVVYTPPVRTNCYSFGNNTNCTTQ